MDCRTEDWTVRVGLNTAEILALLSGCGIVNTWYAVLGHFLPKSFFIGQMTTPQPEETYPRGDGCHFHASSFSVNQEEMSTIYTSNDGRSTFCTIQDGVLIFCSSNDGLTTIYTKHGDVSTMSTVYTPHTGISTHSTFRNGTTTVSTNRDGMTIFTAPDNGVDTISRKLDVDM